MIVLLFFLSLIQTIIGILFIEQISNFFTVGDLNLGFTIFLLVLAIALAILVVYRIRQYDVWLPIIVEVILTPLALFRFLIGGLISLIMQRNFALTSNASELLNSVTEYVIYLEVTDTVSLSKGGNLLSMVLFAFPVSFIMSYSFWNDIFLCDFVFEKFGITLPRYNIVIGIIIIMFLSGALCVIRNQPAEHKVYNPNYKFENRYTGKTKSTYSNDYLMLTDKSLDKGWHRVRGGDEMHLSVEMILTLVFSPILVFTYFIGIIAAILSCFILPIYSCIGQINYNDVPLGSLQRVLHFFCGFVIAPELNENRQIIKTKNNIHKKLNQNKNEQVKKTNSPTVKRKRKPASIKDGLLWPFAKIGKGISKLIEYFKDKCDSAGDVILCILMVIFFPFVLVFIGIRALVRLISNNSESFLGVLAVIGKVLFSPFLLIGKFFGLFRNKEEDGSLLATFAIAFLALLLAVGYYFLGKTGVIGKMTFEINMSWFTRFFVKFHFTGLVANLFEGAGLLSILLAILIAIVAVVEFVLLILSWLVGLVIIILSVVLQLGYILIIPVALVVVPLIILIRNISSSGVIGSILVLLMIGGACTLVVFYGIDLFALMFPN